MANPDSILLRFTPELGEVHKLSHFDLGSGYDIKKLAEGSNGLKGKMFKCASGESDIVTIVSKTTESSCEKIETRRELEKSLVMEGSLSLSYGLLSGAGSGFIADSVSSEGRQVTVIYTVVHNHAYREIPDGMRVISQGAERFKADGGTESLFAHFGSHFVSRIYYGASLSVTAKLMFGNTKDANEFKAQLSGSFGLGELSAEVSASVKKRDVSEDYEFRFSAVAKAQGINFQLKDVADMKGVESAIQDFEMEAAKVSRSAEKAAAGDQHQAANLRAIAAELDPAEPFIDWCNLPAAHAAIFLERVQQAASRIVETAIDTRRLDAFSKKLRITYHTPEGQATLLAHWDQGVKVFEGLREQRRADALKLLYQPSVEAIIDPSNNMKPRDPRYERLVQGLTGTAYVDLMNGYFYEGFLTHDEKAFIDGTIFYRQHELMAVASERQTLFNAPSGFRPTNPSSLPHKHCRPGSYPWPVPKWATRAKVELHGGGGASGGGWTSQRCNCDASGGGGGGGYTVASFDVKPSEGIKIIVASGGEPSTGDGGNGGVSAVEVGGVELAHACGGVGGVAYGYAQKYSKPLAASYGKGGAGAFSSMCSRGEVTRGGDGCIGMSYSDYVSNHHGQSYVGPRGQGGSSHGPGGKVLPGGLGGWNTSGWAGTHPGCGGGGGTGTRGNRGADGQVLIWWS